MIAGVSSDNVGVPARSYEWEIYIFALLPCKSDAKQKIAKTREFFVLNCTSNKNILYTRRLVVYRNQR